MVHLRMPDRGGGGVAASEGQGVRVSPPSHALSGQNRDSICDADTEQDAKEYPSQRGT